MNQLSEKLQTIYTRFLIIAVGFILTYTLLNWLLFIKAEIPLKEDITKFWLPFGLPWIPILIWLRPRIKILNFKNDNASFGYQFIASLVIAIPTIITQDYLSTVTGKLTQLQNIDQVANFEKTKYYSLENFFIDKIHIAISKYAKPGRVFEFCSDAFTN